MGSDETIQLPVPLGVAQLGRTRPHDVALTNLRKTWTFLDLAGHSAAVAQFLLADNTERPVAVIVDRSLESVAALIGVWWAGRGVVVMDTSDPDERINEFVGRVGANVVIDASSSPRSMRGDHEVVVPPPPMLDPDTWPEVRARPSEAPAVYQFTSGSTGRSKCVARSVRNYCWVQERRVGPDAYVWTDTAAITYPLHFAMGFSVTLLGLGLGRFTVLVDPQMSTGEQLLAQVDALGAEWLYGTPSLLRALAASLPAHHRMNSLKKVWAVGEPLHWGDVRLVRDHFGPQVTLCAGYGASEAMGILCSMQVGPNGEIEGEGPLPIGLRCRTTPSGCARWARAVSPRYS